MSPLSDRESAARAVKATRLADATSEALRFVSAALELGAMPDDEVARAATHLDNVDWETIARLSGLRPPSRATIAAALALLRLRTETKDGRRV